MAASDRAFKQRSWAREAMLSSDPPLANPEDMDIPRCVATADEAIALLRDHLERWQAAQRGSGHRG